MWTGSRRARSRAAKDLRCGLLEAGLRASSIAALDSTRGAWPAPSTAVLRRRAQRRNAVFDRGELGDRIRRHDLALVLAETAHDRAHGFGIEHIFDTGAADTVD